MKDKKDSAQQDAGRNFQRAAKPNLTEYEKVQEAFRKNFERLKAERLAREAKTDDKYARTTVRSSRFLIKVARAAAWSCSLATSHQSTSPNLLSAGWSLPRT